MSVADGYCASHPEDGWLSGLIRTSWCGLTSVVDTGNDPLELAASEGGQTVRVVAAEAGETGRTVATEAGSTGRAVANPWNALTLGAGLSAGLTVPIVVVGGVGSILAADWLVNDGKATGAVLRGLGRLLGSVV